MPRPKFPDRLAKYEVFIPGLSPTERAEREAEQMYKYLRREIDRDTWREDNFFSLVAELREMLKDDDVKAVLQRGRLREFYKKQKIKLEQEANRVYENLRRIGRKEKEAIDARDRVYQRVRDKRNKIDGDSILSNRSLALLRSPKRKRTGNP